ncbi:MAG: hypothetical protein WAT39_17275 [Planctomycetota bacterium]
MNTIRTALAVLVLAAIAPTQRGAAPSAPGQAEYDKLVAEWKAESKASREASKVVQATEEFKAAAAAKDQAKQRELMAAVKRPDAKAYGERALKLADQFGNDGVRFLAYAAANFADKDTAAGIAERIGTKYIKSKAVVALLESPLRVLGAIGPDAAGKLLDQIVAENPDDQAKAWAMYWQSTQLSRGKPTDEQKAKAAELTAAATKLATGDLADRLAAPAFQQERLQIGMAAPDIVGEDIDGVPFKLSDYQGKVVVLDFWGFW